MGKILIGVLIGLLVGGGAMFFAFGGIPRASEAPGTPIKAPDPNATAPAVEIVLKQDFLNQVVNTIFRDMNDPAFTVGVASGESGKTGGFEYQNAAFQDAAPCDGNITILEQGSGVRTGVEFVDGEIAAPIAFSGSYNSPIGCLRFSGWSQAKLSLRFDKAQGSVFGQIDVGTVNLDGINPIFSGFVTPIVQTTLNNRVNPITIVQGTQLAVDLPINSASGNLNAAVSDVRAEVKQDDLHLYVTYEFSGTPTSNSTQ